MLFLRLLFASIVATSLVACSGAAGIPGAAQQSIERLPMHDAPRGSTPPCDFPHVWHFNGPCKAFTMKKQFTGITLDEYRGLTLTIRWPAEHPPQLDNRFVTSVATGDGDITGTLKGKRFPLYGSVRCYDPYFRKMSCPGKAFLYRLFENSSAFEIGWDTTPKFTIVNQNPFSGHKCQWAVLVRVAKGFAWQVYPFISRPKNRTLVMEPLRFPASLPSGGLAIEGFVCSQT